MSDLKDFLFHPVENNWIGWIMLGLIWAIVLFLAAVIIYAILSAIDRWFCAKIEGYGTVQYKTFVPAHYESSYNAALKMPTTIFVPNTWYIQLGIDDKTGVFYCDKPTYDTVKIAQRVYMRYFVGRLWTKHIHIKWIKH